MALTAAEKRRKATAQQRERRRRNPEKVRSYERAYRARHPERIKVRRRVHNMWSLYRLTPEQVVELFARFEGLCAVCREQAAEHVDHDHKTGRVRGALCSDCNLGLGRFKDDPKRLTAAIAYLEAV